MATNLALQLQVIEPDTDLNSIMIGNDKKKLIVQLVDYEELKSENERLKKQLAKK